MINEFDNQTLRKDYLDGVSFSFKDWRFNLRLSNTENLLRLNIEGFDKPELVQKMITRFSEILEKT